MNGLIIIERIVLESIARKEKNIEQILDDTFLPFVIVQNALTFLMIKNIITYKKGIYFVNEDNKSLWLKKINSRENIKEEIKELCTGIVNQYFDQGVKKDDDVVDLNLRKIWLTPGEEKIFNSYLINLNTFIKNIEEDRLLHPVDEKTGEKKVVFWGCSKYSSLANNILKAV